MARSRRTATPYIARIKSLMRKQAMPAEEIAEEMNVGLEVMKSWLDEETPMPLSAVEFIQTLLDADSDDLVGQAAGMQLVELIRVLSRQQARLEVDGALPLPIARETD